MIFIENKPFSIDEYFAGTYTDADDIEHNFTLLNMGEGELEVVWIENLPGFTKAVEERIIEKFKSK